MREEYQRANQGCKLNFCQKMFIFVDYIFITNCTMKFTGKIIHNYVCTYSSFSVHYIHVTSRQNRFYRSCSQNVKGGASLPRLKIKKSLSVS